jgi:hypothetical protein
MFQGQPLQPLSAVWVAFYEDLIPSAATSQAYGRTLDLNNCTVGNNIAPCLTAQASGTAFEVSGVLRKAITANLVVRINVNQNPFITCTVNAVAKPFTALTWTSFSTDGTLAKGDIFSFDVLASDGSIDPNGIASFTVQWR